MLIDAMNFHDIFKCCNGLTFDAVDCISIFLMQTLADIWYLKHICRYSYRVKISIVKIVGNVELLTYLPFNLLKMAKEY